MALGSKSNLRRVKHPRYKWLVTFRDGGKIRKKYFSTKAEAEDWVSARDAEALHSGTGIPIADEERSAVVEMRPHLSDVGISMRQARDLALSHLRKLKRSVPVSQLTQEVLTLTGTRDSGAALGAGLDGRGSGGRVKSHSFRVNLRRLLFSFRLPFGCHEKGQEIAQFAIRQGERQSCGHERGAEFDN